MMYWKASNLSDGRSVQGHSERIVSIAAAGEVLATGGEDGRIVLWNDQTFEPIATLGDHPAPIREIAMSRKASRLAVLDGTGTLSVRNVDVDSWIARACSVAGRLLTEEEKRRFLGGQAFPPVCPPFP
jgi:WD40 repeat protein